MPVLELKDFVLWDAIRGPLHAKSRTADKIGHVDFAMIVPPIRLFVYLSLFPFLCYPAAALYGFGYYRCLRTTLSPMGMRGYDRYEEASKQYVVQKRVYDKRQRRYVETQIMDDIEQIDYAIKLAGDRRNEFIDDPNQKGVAYYIQERLLMKTEALFTGENWAWAITSDVFRYLLPVGLCFIFHPAAQRVRVDLQLMLQGRLKWRQVRHPILNFMKTGEEYRRSKARMNMASPVAAGAKPWNYKM